MSSLGTIDVPIAEITRHADVNVALVSYHFNGREGLLVELAREDAEFALEGLQRLLAREFDPAEMLRRHIIGVVRVFYERPYLHRLLHTLLREGSRSAAEAVADFFVAPLALARRKIIQDGIEAGLFRNVEPEMIALSIDGACEHVFSSPQSRRISFGDGAMTKELSEQYAQSISELYVRGVLKDSAGDA